MLFHALIQTSSRYFSRLKWVCRAQTLTNTERHISSLHSHLWVQLSAESALPSPTKTTNSCNSSLISRSVCISSNEIPPRSACKCSQYKSIAIHLKYVIWYSYYGLSVRLTGLLEWTTGMDFDLIFFFLFPPQELTIYIEELV